MNTVTIKTKVDETIEDVVIETRYLIGDWAVHPTARENGLDHHTWTVTCIANGLRIAVRYERKLALFIAAELDAMNADFAAMTERHNDGTKTDEDKAAYAKAKLILAMYDDDDYEDDEPEYD